MKRFLVGFASRGNESFTRNCELIKAADAEAAKVEMETRLSINGGWCMGLREWYVAYVVEHTAYPAGAEQFQS